MDRSSKVEAEYVGKRVYIGDWSEIGPKSIIGESAIILSSAVLPSHVIVLPTEIVASTPTSLYFYRQSGQFILSDKYDSLTHC